MLVDLPFDGAGVQHPERFDEYGADQDGLNPTEAGLADMGLCIMQTDPSQNGFDGYCGEPAYKEGLEAMDLGDRDLSYCAADIRRLQDVGHPDLRHVPLPDDVDWLCAKQAGFTRAEYDQAVRADAVRADAVRAGDEVAPDDDL